MTYEKFTNWLQANGWLLEHTVKEASVEGGVYTKRTAGPGSSGAWVEVLTDGLVTTGFVNAGGPFQREQMAELRDFSESLSPSGALQFVEGKKWRSAP